MDAVLIAVPLGFAVLGGRHRSEVRELDGQP